MVSDLFFDYLWHPNWFLLLQLLFEEGFERFGDFSLDASRCSAYGISGVMERLEGEEVEEGGGGFGCGVAFVVEVSRFGFGEFFFVGDLLCDILWEDEGGGVVRRLVNFSAR